RIRAILNAGGSLNHFDFMSDKRIHIRAMVRTKLLEVHAYAVGEDRNSGTVKAVNNRLAHRWTALNRRDARQLVQAFPQRGLGGSKLCNTGDTFYLRRGFERAGGNGGAGYHKLR